MSKILIDTNICLDVLLNRKEFYDNSRKILQLNKKTSVKAYITTKQLTDIYYILKKHKLNDEKSRNSISILMKLLRVCDISADDCARALDSSIKDFEDAILSETARRNHMDYIITRNTKDFTYSVVKAIEPKEFLN